MTYLKQFVWVLLVICGVGFIGCSSGGEAGQENFDTAVGTDGQADDDNDTQDNDDTQDDTIQGDDDDDNGIDISTDTFDECAAVVEEAQNGYGPVDIIFAIDNTPSMGDEIEEVRSNMNAFSTRIAEFGIDARIVLISLLPGDSGGGGGGNSNGICIDPPLGAADGCQPIGDEEEGAVTNDNNPPGYTHVSTRVPSQKGLRWIVDKYSEYADVLRPNAKKHIVVVSDDTDETTADEFNTNLLNLDETLFADYLFHGIFSYYSKEDACEMEPENPCCQFAAPGGEGIPYRELVELTGGTSGDLCLQDFDGVFDATASNVIDTAELSCEWEIPEPPEGMTFDPHLVNVVFDDNQGNINRIGHVDTEATCDKVEHGWYYDDNQSPKKVLVCPQTCHWIQGKPGAQISVEFGCETEDVIID